MRAYLYVGKGNAWAVSRLAMSAAGLRLLAYTAAYRVPRNRDPFAPYAGLLPIDLVHVRLPGLGLPRSYTAANEVAAHTALAVLRQVVASGAYHLVTMDGIHEAVTHGIADVAELRRLVGCATDGTEIAMTEHCLRVGVFQ